MIFIMKTTKLLAFFLSFIFMPSLYAIESLDGFLVESLDSSYKVISPQKYKPRMEVIVENKTLTKLVGKLHVNNKPTNLFYTISPGAYEKKIVDLKKGDILHFVPISPPFQEVELIVGNKIYEIPPKK